MTSASKELLNKDGILISDDPIIAQIFKNVTIQTQIVTPKLKEIQKNIQNLALDTFYKISIEISNYFQQDDLPVDGNQQDLDEIITIFNLVTQILIKNELLTSEEAEADLKDIKHCYGHDFTISCTRILETFIKKMSILNESAWDA